MPVWNTYVWVDSADRAAARVREAGGTALMAPFDVIDAGRAGIFADPSGASFRVWEAGRHRGAQLVNEPGTWVFSELNTRDLDGSRAFYGAVFGWEASTVDLAGSETVMWRRPGYGDVLVQLNPPGWREQLSEFGAPDGFADAVAWMTDMSRGPFPADVPPHWSVTFSVDDTDGAVDRAVKLGGRVVAEPFDAPPVRMAVLADPEGTVFTVSHFNPTMPS
jgi:predicted enzyme related to lactoylglutathione lyase